MASCGGGVTRHHGVLFRVAVLSQCVVVERGGGKGRWWERVGLFVRRSCHDVASCGGS